MAVAAATVAQVRRVERHGARWHGDRHPAGVAAPAAAAAAAVRGGNHLERALLRRSVDQRDLHTRQLRVEVQDVGVERLLLRAGRRAHHAALEDRDARPQGFREEGLEPRREEAQRVAAARNSERPQRALLTLADREREVGPDGVLVE